MALAGALMLLGAALLAPVAAAPTPASTAASCPDACVCFRDARLWMALPREDSLTARCTKRGLETLPRGLDGDVRHLDASGNWLARLGDGELLELGLRRLLSLDLSGNELAHVEAGAFRGMHDLRRVSLARNKLRSLPADLFSDAPHLWWLSLADNPLVMPADKPLLVAHSLLVLDLSRCGLNAFPDGVLGVDNALQELSVSSNAIAHVRISQLASLRRLDASDNHLGRVPEEALSAAPQLRSLALDGNPLRAGPLASSSSLRELSAGRCGLRHVPRSALETLPHLEELSLDENGVSELSEDVFSVLPALRRLSLANNRLQRLPSGVFAHNEHLRALDLTRNPLEASVSAVNEESSDGSQGHAAWLEARGLRELSLAHCGLRLLPPRLLAGVPALRNLSVAGNELRGVDAQLLETLPRLRALDLRGNPLRCDASLRKLWMAAHAQHLRTTATCVDPPGDWEMLAFLTPEGTGTAVRERSMNDTDADTSSRILVAASVGGNNSVVDALTEGAVRWGPPLGLIVVASLIIVGVRKWMYRMSVRHHLYAARSKEYVYESDDDEAATMTVTTDAGSPRVTPTSPSPPASAISTSSGGKGSGSRFAVTFVDEAPLVHSFAGAPNTCEAFDNRLRQDMK